MGSASAKPFQPVPEASLHAQWNEGLGDHGYDQQPAQDSQLEKRRGTDVDGAENSSRPVNQPVKHGDQLTKRIKSANGGWSSMKKGEPSKQRSHNDKKMKTWKAKDKCDALKLAGEG